MGRKSRENQNRRERLAQRAKPVNYAPLPKKKGIANITKILLGVVLIIIIAVAASVALSTPPKTVDDKGYPTNVSPTTYMQPTISAGNNEVSVPLDYVNSSKLVFVDLKLTAPKQVLDYQSRTIPLINYRNGEYLPLIIIATPSGNFVSGVRTCEPCNSFSFHIVRGANLQCDVCGAEWLLEDFSPISGGCSAYPPPKLPTTIDGDNIKIDLSALQLQYYA